MLPQLPQWLTLLFRLVQVPLQLVKPPQSNMQELELQYWLLAQTCPHEPQLSESVLVSVQEPEQSVFPPLHTVVH